VVIAPSRRVVPGRPRQTTWLDRSCYAHRVAHGIADGEGLPLERTGTTMASPQTGIFALGTASHAYLEFDLLDGADAASAVARVAGFREPRTTIGGVNLVAGFRPELWAAVAPEAAPVGVTGFDAAVVGSRGYTLPATQHDIVVWLTGAGYDVVFDLSRDVVNELTGQAELAHELVGWPYHHDLDLTGFMDGTENPTLIEATAQALLPAGSPGEGGSILLLQQWEHDAAAWEALPVSSQEAVIGRRKILPNSS
jgi:putative iron-dependent peroxidase